MVAAATAGRVALGRKDYVQCISSDRPGDALRGSDQLVIAAPKHSILWQSLLLTTDWVGVAQRTADLVSGNDWRELGHSHTTIFPLTIFLSTTVAILL
jgi:hypothetical protein